jgi:hypothetical protein
MGLPKFRGVDQILDGSKNEDTISAEHFLLNCLFRTIKLASVVLQAYKDTVKLDLPK